jgi:hypothetical protein
VAFETKPQHYRPVSVRSVSTSSAKSFKRFDNKFSTANIANNSERKRESQENVVLLQHKHNLKTFQL